MNYKAVYFPEQWSITNGGVPVCHFQGKHNNKEYAEFVADLLNNTPFTWQCQGCGAVLWSNQNEHCPNCG